MPIALTRFNFSSHADWFDMRDLGAVLDTSSATTCDGRENLLFASAGCHAIRHVGDRSDFRIGDSRSASRRNAKSAGRSATSFCNSMGAWASSLSSMA